MTNTADHINALTTAVTNTDKARRVGWARAYAAEQTKDDLSRDINILRSERDIMRRAWSFMFGFIERYTPQAHYMLNQRLKTMGAILDPGAATGGRRAADIQMEQDGQRAERETAAKAERRKNERMWKNAREAERERLRKRYGFPDEAAFINYLEAYTPE